MKLPSRDMREILPLVMSPFSFLYSVRFGYSFVGQGEVPDLGRITGAAT